MVDYRLNDTMFADELLGRKAVYVRSEGFWVVIVPGFGPVGKAKTIDVVSVEARSKLRYLIQASLRKDSEKIVRVDFCRKIREETLEA